MAEVKADRGTNPGVGADPVMVVAQGVVTDTYTMTLAPVERSAVRLCLELAPGAQRGLSHRTKG